MQVVKAADKLLKRERPLDVDSVIKIAREAIYKSIG